jgi:O-antigen/teichoic acid export membrane protein
MKAYILVVLMLLVIQLQAVNIPIISGVNKDNKKKAIEVSKNLAKKTGIGLAVVGGIGLVAGGIFFGAKEIGNKVKGKKEEPPANNTTSSDPL